MVGKVPSHAALWGSKHAAVSPALAQTLSVHTQLSRSRSACRFALGAEEDVDGPRLLVLLLLLFMFSTFL